MGMMFAFIYDCIRVFRRVFKHKHVYTMAVEDILFWFYVSIRVFTCLYERNNGIIRGFIVISQIFGALIYRYAFGKLFVKYMTGLLIFILKPLKKLFLLIPFGYRINLSLWKIWKKRLTLIKLISLLPIMGSVIILVPLLP